MTDKTIKDLFYGNLSLFDRPMRKSDEYNQSLHDEAEAREALDAVLNDEQKKLLNIYVDRATVSLRPQVIKKLLPKPVQEWLTSRQNRTCFVGSGKKQA